MPKNQKHKGRPLKIILTGGGTAGHVMVNIALLPFLKKDGWEISYIGSRSGIERRIVPKDIKYHSIFTGKLRRYFDWQNFWDIFRVCLGFVQCMFLMGKTRPRVVFSKGGFVSVPVVAAAFFWRIKVIAHEADITPGLANRIAGPFISEYCLAFEKTRKYLPENKCHVTGIPVRAEILSGKRDEGFRLTGFHKEKPVLLVMGGSSGARIINQCIFDNIEGLLKDFQVLHICGKGQLNKELRREGYLQFEYVSHELPHFMKMAQLAVSRAGANALFELLALKIPHLLIPLSKAASRGDQIDNAAEFEAKGFSRVLPEEKISPSVFLQETRQLYKNRDSYIASMENSPPLCDPLMVYQIIQKSL